MQSLSNAAFVLEKIYTDSQVMLLKIEIYTDCVYTGNVLIDTDSM